MADPFSVFASVTSLLDISTRCAKGLYKLIQEFRHAPVELLALSNELTDLRTVLQEVEGAFANVASTSTPQRSQDTLKVHLDGVRMKLIELEALLGSLSCTLPSGTTSADKFGWLRSRATVNKLQRSIKERRQNIHLVLSTIIASSSTRIELAVNAIRTATSQQQNGILARIDQATTSHHATMEGFIQQSLSSMLNQLSTHQQQTSEHLTQISMQRRASRDVLDQVLRTITIVNSNQRVVGQVSSEPLSQDHESRQNNLDETISQSLEPQPFYQSTSFASFSMTRSQNCGNECVCTCHKRRRFMTPQLVKNILGTLFLGYTGCPMLEGCSDKSCRRHSARLLELTYYFPIWIVARVIFLIIGIPHTGSPTFRLVIRKTVPFSSEPYLFRMASNGNAEGIKSLFKSCQAHASDLSDSGNSALFYAVSAFRIDVIPVLLSSGADINIRNLMGFTPAMVAWRIIFLGFGTPEQRQGLEKYLPISAAVDLWEFSHIHKTVLGVLNLNLEIEIQKAHYKEQIDVVDTTGQTPLHWAAYRGDGEAVQLLLRNGANPNACDDSNRTALNMSAMSGSLCCTEYLLSAGVKVDNTDSTGRQAIHHACEGHGNLAVVKALIRAGASVNVKNNRLETPLTLAASFDAEAIGIFLLHAGANVNHLDGDGDTALFCALCSRSQAMLELLLSKGADYRIINKHGHNILHYAAFFADIRMIQTLSQTRLHGVDTEAKDLKDRTTKEILNQRAAKLEGLVEAFEFLLQSVRDANDEARVEDIAEEVVEENEDEFVEALETQEEP